MFIFIFVFVFVVDAPVTEEKEGDNLARLLSWSIGKNNFEGTERKKTEKNILRDKSVSVSVKQQKKCSIQTLNISQLLFFRLWSFWNVRLLSWNQYFNIFFKNHFIFLLQFLRSWIWRKRINWRKKYIACNIL